MSSIKLKSLDRLSDKLWSWGYDRDFYVQGGATIQGQLKQLATELIECSAELDGSGLQGSNFYLELGDILVTALMACHVAGVDPRFCLSQAYDKIKDRKGKMVKGKFVKQEDL